jgi:hypothetical protein
MEKREFRIVVIRIADGAGAGAGWSTPGLDKKSRRRAAVAMFGCLLTGWTRGAVGTRASCRGCRIPASSTIGPGHCEKCRGIPSGNPARRTSSAAVCCRGRRAGCQAGHAAGTAPPAAGKGVACRRYRTRCACSGRPGCRWPWPACTGRRQPWWQGPPAAPRAGNAPGVGRPRWLASRPSIRCAAFRPDGSEKAHFKDRASRMLSPCEAVTTASCLPDLGH